MTHTSASIANRLAGVNDAVAWLRSQGAKRLQCDSRQVQPGDAFVAWPGFATDGRLFVPDALRAGAVACLVEADGLPHAFTDRPEVAGLSNLKAETGRLAALFYGHPSASMDVVAVTGTNGKTSTTWWLAQALTALGRRCGLMGTLGVGVPAPGADALAGLRATGLTTPDPVVCQATFRQWADDGIRACAIEASSIGLAEHRLAGTDIAVAVFTNFTQDHLDYHGSMQAYWQAKHALFQMPGLRAAVVNVDDPRGAALASELLAATKSEQPAPVVWSYSLRPDTAARLTARDLKATTAGQSCVVEERLSGGERVQARFSVPFVGSYNVANLLGVVASLRALGFSLVEALQACGALAPVPGRLAAVNADSALPASDRLPLVLVDYAHTPDALEQVLLALRPVSQLRGGALHCVVGCGGDRDAGKRPLMAAKAEAGADRVCLTSDNPRSEDPMHILGQMSAGLKDPSTVSIQPDRAQAIAHVIANAAQPDVVLIAGKGHETTQDIQGVKHPFSDHQHALAALQQRWKDVQP